MLNFICPLIVVEDITRSRTFYESILEQEVKFDFGEDVTFKGNFAIHQKTHFQKLLGDSTKYPVVTRAHNCELYFNSEKIEGIQKRLKEHSVEFIHELKEQPWGQRVMRFYDPDGHIIEIGEPMDMVILRLSKQELSVQEVCRRTVMPEEFVKQILKEHR